VEEKEEEVCGTDVDSERRCICYKRADRLLKTGISQTLPACLWVQVVWSLGVTLGIGDRTCEDFIVLYTPQRTGVEQLLCLGYVLLVE
jgi:hypothetical protein